MSDTSNLYRSPGTVAAPDKSLPGQNGLTETMLLYLKGASPWIRFIGILGYISAAFVVLTGIFFFAIGSFFAQVWSSIPGFEELGGLNNSMGSIFGVIMGLIFVGCAVLMFFLSRFSYNFGAKIRNYLHDGRDEELEQAFRNNKSLWKLLGILSIIELAFLPLSMIISIGAAVASLIP